MNKIRPFNNKQDKNSLDSKKYVRTKELSILLDTPAYTIRRLAREGILPAYRITGKDYLFDPDEIFSFISKKKKVIKN
ncbi:MAG TPA: helix-turn-helix domain-containing protein [Spirochaetota bacterium]|nr:helix-turn-helix domain-containing protein [Spirochaetota bacterium]HPL15177.1 helix-turn-helix domain-containing protein [Spirochaetota bacterium]HQF09887.1 helix-turn-helix domain-containing protein [Spirochaetota bacterium]HQH98538.1 helix-turn-helix domain-containing protein [Spirochaetota bacterium]HQJ71962.1 helix-turn-helix domain-containing protein [Spirochaetota bacterium]